MDKVWRQVYLLKLKYKNGEEVSDSIGLLISILVRYPEVGSTNFDPETRKLTLTFTISKILDNDSLKLFKNKLLSCINTFHFLQSRKPLLVDIKNSTYDKLTMLEVQRDVETITHNEINLIISLENIKESTLGKKLFAFREEGRVLVFNK